MFAQFITQMNGWLVTCNEVVRKGWLCKLMQSSLTMAQVVFKYQDDEEALRFSQQQQASAVICRPTLELFNVVVDLDLSNSNITGVVLKDAYTAPNTVSGGTLNGRVFNA